MADLRFARCLLVLATALATRSAHAIDLIATFGGPEGYGTNTLEPEDDSPSESVDLTPAFPGGLQYFGGTYTTVWLNNNGNITFNAALITWTPAAFPIASQPMIAPWWGDVDTRGGGAPATNSVWWHVAPGQAVFTWNQVGYFASATDKENSFQLILSTDPACPGPGNFDVEFRYAQCQWTAGGASGGTDGVCAPGSTGCVPAQAGFDAGNLHDYYAIPESRTDAILDVCTMSNGGLPGDWVFTICDGMITGGCPGAGAPCIVPGLFGACAHGVQHCAGMGGTVCVQNVFPTTDRCDGLDEACTATYDGDVPPRPCYDGPSGTEGVGVCRGGMQTCVDGASWGACMGDVLPSAEICDDLDNDCNGSIDDGVAPRACYTGPDGTEGVGACHGGMQGCSLGAWGPCNGEQTPQADTCNGIDSLCNGMPPVDAGLPDCVPPPEDSSVPVDASEDVAPPTDAQCLSDPRCNPHLLIGGSAGPIGCACSVTHMPDARTTVAVSALMAAFAFAAARRRRR